MKRILIFLLVFCLVFMFPCVSYASEIPSDDDFRVSVKYLDKYNYLIKSWSGNIEERGSLSIDQEFIYSGNYTYGIRLYLGFDISEYLNEYLSLIQNATNVWVGINFHSRLGFLPNDMLNSQNKLEASFTINNTLTVVDTLDFTGSYMGNYTFTPYKLPNNKDYTSGDIVESGFEFYCYTGTPLELREIFLQMKSFTITLYLQGIDGQSYNQFIVITNQLDSVESSINQLKSEVSSKLDSILTPDSDNQQAVDQMGGQVDSNKQEAEDIKNQIDSLNKPDPDDLIDQIDPDQFIDNDNEAVHEMTGILASITSNEIVKNYLLLLLGIGIVSFVVYGKKGG